MSHLLTLVKPGNIEIARSTGCFLYDKEGQRYIDLESGVWCVGLGHNHPRINRSINKQLDNTLHLGYQAKNPLPEKLSMALQRKLKFSESKSVFLSSGSEAVDLAISISKHITNRNKICVIEGSYLSAFGHGKSQEGNKNLVSIENNNYTKLASFDFKDIAAFVFEPGTAWGKISFPSTEFIDAISKKAKANNCLVIVDEVTTGMGRTGKWFGFEHYRMLPDIVVCGKGLGNGYPVSSVTLNKTVANAFEEDPFRYAQSHQNDPLGCSVALEVIKEIERTDLVIKTEEKGILFKSLLKEITRKHPVIKDIRGRGLMLAVEFDDCDNAEKAHRYLLANKIISGIKSNVIRFMPPLIIDHELIHEVVDTFEKSLSLLPAK
ncbi:aspartate aminotransferase family protein [Bacteroidota bacterium]